ncbi:MAG: RpiB/LacA/LacB family sugar-phosphate isomerase [Bdellovibrionales bacterium]|nr:RpiB/LacA/LacB family sugar-phosphate isomerase [Bdellovibrionales bacterium]
MTYSLPLLIASDHAGFHLKKFLIKKAPEQNWKDLGPKTSDRTDYPLWAEKLCRHIQPQLFGILICGSGQGMTMKANRYPYIRAALCLNQTAAHLARLHNDANILCLASRMIAPEKALKVLHTFLSTDFNKTDPAYERRIHQLSIPRV